jgi:tRNA 2-thiouridine synthesizing protein D
MSDYPDFVITLSLDKQKERHVTLAFTLGLKSLEKGYKTAIILLLEGVRVGQKGYIDDIDIGEPFLPVHDMLEVYLDGGGQLLVCGSCWKHEHIPENERLAGTSMITADNVIDLLMNAKSNIQLN